MSRRLAGALLVLLSIVGVTVAASVPGRRLAGIPTSVEFPGPPAVGDCLIAGPVDDGRWVGGTNTSLLRFGPCTGSGAGEVVAVRTVTPADRSSRPGQSTGCRDEALSYAGLSVRDGSVVVPGAPSNDPVAWTYSVDLRASWLFQVPSLPSASTWVACIAQPGGTRLGVGTLANAFDGGALPGVYGTCWQSDEVSAAMQMVNCNAPHVAELVALGRVGQTSAVDRGQIISSCSEQAKIVLRRSDPTVDGALTVDVRPDRTPNLRWPLEVTCFIASSDQRKIIGSVVGLGAKQVRFGK